MIKFLINRPIAVIMSFVLLILLGIIALQQTPISLFPDSSISKLEVIINNPGDSPEDFENEVVGVIRNNLLQVNNIVDIYSYTNKSSGKIELLFNYDVNIDLVFFEVNEKIDEALSTLSRRIDRPKVIKSSLSDIPSLYLAVSINKDIEKPFSELSSFVEKKIKTRLEQNSEISFVDLSGLTKNTIKVSVDERLINAIGLTLNEVKNTLVNNNLSIGNIEISQGDFVYNLSLESSINSIEDIKKIPITINDRTILMSEIADISNDLILKDIYYYNMNQAISLAIVKNPNSRVSSFKQELDEIIEDIQSDYPYINISIPKDQTIILKETLKSLSSSLVLGVILAVIVTFFFLKSIKNVLIIFLAVVSSLVIDFLLFYLWNISINLISISGLILGIGLMIDNIIIVLDNIEQKIGSLKSVKKGTIHGVTEIIPALISSALTTCSIFVPLIFLSGLAGILFYDQAASVTIALISSFFVSIILLPTIYVLLNKSLNREIFNNRLYPYYLRIYNKIDKNKISTSIIIVVIILLGFLSFRLIEKQQLPKLNSSEIVFKIEWNKNYVNSELINRSIKIIDLIKEDISTSEFYVNQQSFLSKTQRKNIEDYETYYILKLKKGRNKETVINKISSVLKEKFNNVNVKLLPEENALNSILITKDYNLEIISYDKEISSVIILNEIEKEIPDLIHNLKGKTETMELHIDENKLFMYDIDRKSLIDYLKLKLAKEKILNINHGNNFTPVTFSLNSESTHSFLNSNFTKEGGEQYALKNLINVKYVTAKKGIEAKNGGISDILYVKTDNPELVINLTKELFPNSSIVFDGSYKQIEKLGNEIIYIILITLTFLYLILSIQFESLKLPLIILLEIPIDIAIAILILYLTNHTLNVMSCIGILIMCGIIINDSILKIDLINKLYRSGENIENAIHMAGKRRLNAIVMTSLTTILAMSPVLFQNDISTQLQAPLIISLLGGLFVGTLVSIFIIPLIYKKIV